MPHITLKILSTIIAYNLYYLFLNEKKVKDIKEYSIKVRKKLKKWEREASFIIYGETTFTIVKFSELIYMILSLDQETQKKFKEQFKTVFDN